MQNRYVRGFEGLSRREELPLRGISAAALPLSSRGHFVLSYRATTGFGGLIVVTAILLVTQLITGFRAFPL